MSGVENGKWWGGTSARLPSLRWGAQQRAEKEKARALSRFQGCDVVGKAPRRDGVMMQHGHQKQKKKHRRLASFSESGSKQLLAPKHNQINSSSMGEKKRNQRQP